MLSIYNGLLQVLPDWRGDNVLLCPEVAQAGDIADDPPQSAWELRLHKFLRAEKVKDYKKENDNKKPQDKDLTCNRAMALSLDNAMRVSLGFGMDRFAPARRLGSLLAGDKRYITVLPPDMQLPGSSPNRSIVESADGVRTVEVPREMLDGRLNRPVWHKAS